jgi:hypothetical protein
MATNRTIKGGKSVAFLIINYKLGAGRQLARRLSSSLQCMYIYFEKLTPSSVPWMDRPGLPVGNNLVANEGDLGRGAHETGGVGHQLSKFGRGPRPPCNARCKRPSAPGRIDGGDKCRGGGVYRRPGRPPVPKSPHLDCRRGRRLSIKPSLRHPTACHVTRGSCGYR